MCCFVMDCITWYVQTLKYEYDRYHDMEQTEIIDESPDCVMSHQRIHWDKQIGRMSYATLILFFWIEYFQNQVGRRRSRKEHSQWLTTMWRDKICHKIHLDKVHFIRSILTKFIVMDLRMTSDTAPTTSSHKTKLSSCSCDMYSHYIASNY